MLKFLLNCALQAFCIPYFIAINRLIVLGEINRSYRLAPGDLRFQRYFWLSIGIDLPIYLVPLCLPYLLLVARPEVSGTTLIAIHWIGYFAVLVLSVRLMVLLPGIAVDMSGARLREMLVAAGELFWRMLAVFALAHLPAFTLWILFWTITEHEPSLASAWVNLAFSIIGGVIATVLMTLSAVIASQFYLRIRHLMPPDAAPVQ